MHHYLARMLGGAAVVLMAGGVCRQGWSAQAVLALCPAAQSVPAVHRLTFDATAEKPSDLIIAEAGQTLPPDCRRSSLPFSTDAVRWLGVLPGRGLAGDRLAITTREKSGEILSIEEEKLQPPRPSKHLPSRRPREGAVLPKLPAAWVWEPQMWRDDPAALIAEARQTGIGAFYISVSIAGGAVEHAEALAAFIRRCREAGIQAYAVEGDPKMITAEGLAHAVSRARALAQYQTAYPNAPLSGVQYDIEPYLLASFGAAPQAAWTRWSTALHSLSRALGEPVDAVIPYWIEDSPGAEEALAAARPALRSITIMAYRTEQAKILDAAAPALLFAERAGLPATVGLEAGPIAAERRNIFRRVKDSRATAGDLHLASLDGVTAALLLDAPRAESATMVFRRSHSVLSDPANVTFHGRTPQLFGVARTLATALTAYPAAERIAFHGLSAFESPKKPDTGQPKDNPNDTKRENPAH